jgi:hypothetical protein
MPTEEREAVELSLKRVATALNGFLECVGDKTRDKQSYEVERLPSYALVQEAMEANNEAAALLATPPPSSEACPEPFQARVDAWLLTCFGPEIARDRIERNHRFLEESLELVQACGCTASEAHQLVDYTFGRPVGEIGQEVGGVMNTLAALCLAYDLDMAEEGDHEMVRCWEKIDRIREKQRNKPKHSPLPASPPIDAGLSGVVDRERAVAEVIAWAKRVGHFLGLAPRRNAVEIVDAVLSATHLPVARIEEVERWLLGDEINGGFVRDLCFTVWDRDETEDWSNDTLPTVQRGVKLIRERLKALTTSVAVEGCQHRYDILSADGDEPAITACIHCGHIPLVEEGGETR